MTPAAVMALQRSVGNGAASRIIAAEGSRPGAGRQEAIAVQRTNTKKKKVTTHRYDEDEYGDGGAGTYRDRHKDKKYLKKEFGSDVDGSTHQSEHIYGVAPMTHLSGERRGETPAMRLIEGDLPAYHETRQAHRDHVGTGSSKKVDRPSGMTSEQYRNAQFTAATHNDPFTGHALNQNVYSHLDSFHAETGTIAGRQADDSHERTVRSGARVSYYIAPGVRRTTRPLNAEEQASLILGRHAGRTRDYPSLREEREVAESVGLSTRRTTRSGAQYSRSQYSPDPSSSSRYEDREGIRYEVREPRDTRSASPSRSSSTRYEYDDDGRKFEVRKPRGYR